MPQIVEFITNVAEVMVGTAPLILIAGAVARPWIEKRIDHSIKHEYEKKLADYQALIDQQAAMRQEQRELHQRAVLVADLLSCWLADTEASRQQLNKLSFEAFLWLPQDIATELSKTLAHGPTAMTARDLLLIVRKLLHGQDDLLKAYEIIVFSKRGPDPA